MSILKSSVLFSLTTWFSLQGHAQQSDSTLDPVTITASVQPLNASQTGRNLIVIDGARFQKLPVHSVDELLRYVPGLEVQARGPMGTQSDFVLRGGTFQQVLVILDGMRLNDPNTGHFSSYIPIAPTEIERIEVLKGASSAIYGSDAVGGVINIVTKTFAAKNNTGIHNNVNAQLTGGEYNLFGANVGVFFQNGKTAVSGGFLANNSDGQLQRGTRGSFHNNTASLSLHQQLSSAWQFNARTAWDSRRFGAQNYYTTSPADTASEKVETFWNQLQLQYQKQNNKISLQGGFKNVTDRFRFNAHTPANNNKSNLFQLLALYEHNFFKTSYLTTGVQFQDRRIKSNDRGNHSVKQAAAFAVLQQQLGAHFNVAPALRLDWDERSGTEFIPQINISFKTGTVQLRGSAGKTIRQPDFTERYNNYNKAFVPSLNRVGNPDLKAETSFSYEAGIDWFAVKGLKLAATYFQRDYSDLIDFASTPYSAMPRKENLAPTGTYFFAENIATVTTRGLETDMVFSKSLTNEQQLSATAGLVFLHTSTNNATPSLYISSHAKFLTNFTINYSTPGWAISTSGLYKERNAQEAASIHAVVSKDYFVWNAKAEVFIIKQKLSVFAEVDNLLNRNYSDLLGAQMPKRWTMGGAKLSL